MYGTDFENKMMQNRDYDLTNGATTNNWVMGTMDWSASPQNTNTALLLSER